MSDQANKDDQYPRPFGNYHLLAPLAQGGMGALYLAVRGDRGLERLLVIKTVLPHLADAEYVARFRDEAKVVVKLSHGNLIPVFDAGTVDGELFLAMDFVEGRDLRAVWNRCAKKQVAFPVDVAVFIIKELCRGLAYAHSFRGLKLVHRDISPPNILISYSGEVKVTDFGLASSTMKLEKTAPGIIYGKVAYMSPEQARGELLDGRSDMYAVAIVLWELLTGRQLFPPGKDQPQDLLQRAKNPVVTPPSKRAPRVPPSLDAIVLKGLAPLRDDRYADCEEFRQALSDWLATEAPGTDAARLETFLYDLFAEDIERERAEREILLQKMRKRVMTPPPGELPGVEGADGDLDGKLMRAPDSVGRRAMDRGEPAADRRQSGDRRQRTGAEAREGDTGLLADSGLEITARASESKDEIGQIIDGRYRVLELIGEGGMGRVYMAEHVDIGRRVAIKILHPVYSRMPELVERFRREARAATKIGNPHIVDVTDSGTTKDGSAYFVMEYLEGEELSAIIAREGALNATRSLRIAVQISQALAAAHEAGIIHRDLKPENIFLTTQQGNADFVKVLDFGVAISTEAGEVRDKRLTTPGMAMGTPEYMAPEQAAGKPADERCDVYAVGAILYEALVGVPPYIGNNFMEILTKKATVDPEPVKKLRPELSDEISALVSRIMARRPEDRPASMAALEYEINKCLEGRGMAVAKVLGMSGGAELADELSMGFKGRDEQATQRRRGTSQTMAAASPGRDSEDPFEMDVVESTDGYAKPVQVRSRWIVIGLIALTALLIAGVGAVMLVPSGERSHGTVPVVAADAAPVVPVAERPADAGVEIEFELVDAAMDAAPDAAPNAPPDAAPTPAPKALTADEAKELLSKADQQASSSEWAKARRTYAQVADSGYFKDKAYLGMARASYEMNDIKGTIQHAKRAMRAGAGVEARMLLGQSLFKNGQYEDALRYFNDVLKSDPANKGAQRGAQMARDKLQR